MDRDEVFRFLSDSTITDAEFLEWAYKNTLKRSADEVGRDGYLLLLFLGASRRWVLRRLAASPEGKAAGAMDEAAFASLGYGNTRYRIETIQVGLRRLIARVLLGPTGMARLVSGARAHCAPNANAPAPATQVAASATNAVLRAAEDGREGGSLNGRAQAFRYQLALRARGRA